jgi:hypothetical protein
VNLRSWHKCEVPTDTEIVRLSGEPVGRYTKAYCVALGVENWRNTLCVPLHGLQCLGLPLAPLRHADVLCECPVIGVNPK